MMGGIFGGGASKRAEAEARKQAAEARREKQTASEEGARSQQQAERSGGSSGRGRNMLVGTLSSALKKTLGG